MIENGYSLHKRNLVILIGLKGIQDRASEGSIWSLQMSSDPRSDARPDSDCIRSKAFIVHSASGMARTRCKVNYKSTCNQYCSILSLYHSSHYSTTLDQTKYFRIWAMTFVTDLNRSFVNWIDFLNVKRQPKRVDLFYFFKFTFSTHCWDIT